VHLFAKTKILSPYYLFSSKFLAVSELCRKFALLVEKLPLPGPPILFNL